MPDAKLPATAGDVAQRFPEVWNAYAKLGAAISGAGPLAGRERRLVKLALAIGSGSEGAVHSHTRQALAEGISAEDVRHSAILGITTLGFPRAMAALSWVDDIIEKS